ncbi:MAG: hypothetical protein Q9162_004875 [Coniocarpon cinnabarinum]
MAPGHQPARRHGPPPPTASAATAALSHAHAQLRPSSEDQSAAPSNGEVGSSTTTKPRHRGNRNRKKKKNRRQSFATPDSQGDVPDTGAHRPSLLDVPEETTAESQFDRLGATRRTTSHESMESEALLDHRNQHTTRPRRQSIIHALHAYNSDSTPRAHPRPQQHHYFANNLPHSPLRGQQGNDENDPDDRTPLMGDARRQSPNAARRQNAYGGTSSASNVLRNMSNNRRTSASSSVSAKRRRKMPSRQQSQHSIPLQDEYDVNNPPSQPGSPRLGPDDDFDEVMLPEFTKHGEHGSSRDHIIQVDDSEDDYNMSPMNRRRMPTGRSPVEDVCLPFDQMTDIAEEDLLHQEGSEGAPKRSHKRPWPDLSALEEWALEEKEERTMEGVRAKKVSEPELVGGRLRPARISWQREPDEDDTFRFTYFNEELDSSLRSFTLSGLEQLGLSFQELFIPDPPEIVDDSSSEDGGDDDNATLSTAQPERTATPVNGQSRASTRQSSINESARINSASLSADRQGSTASTVQPASRSATPTPRVTSPNTPATSSKPKRYGPRPVFWLDILSPTFEEMRVICRAFGIHKLTAEDIMEQEAREKVELFRNYYFVNYRTFEQDEQSDDHLEPVNMYFVVFKGGVISFHFNQMPHPPNVRRRIRQLAEHQYTDSDWISYAIIDNITDAYAPLIEQIEKEVDDIDDEILQLHSRPDPADASVGNSSAERNKRHHQRHSKGSKLLHAFKTGGAHHVYEKLAESAEEEHPLEQKESNHGDMLLRVGECRKKVMGLYRLLGNKADVIKGLAKRCNEQWQVAPRSDVGLYLGDIQDHIVTMTGNLTHYENILSRAHSNYLAQINIKMTERAEQTNDVLGKLTVLGTIVLPMNIITGMWGMNVLWVDWSEEACKSKPYHLYLLVLRGSLVRTWKSPPFFLDGRQPVESSLDSLVKSPDLQPSSTDAAYDLNLSDDEHLAAALDAVERATQVPVHTAVALSSSESSSTSVDYETHRVLEASCSPPPVYQSTRFKSLYAAPAVAVEVGFEDRLVARDGSPGKVATTQSATPNTSNLRNGGSRTSDAATVPASNSAHDDDAQIRDLNAPLKEDTRSPIQRFRAHKPLSVTDFTSPAWCELQYLYSLTHHGRKRRTPAMKRGSSVHKDLEDEVHVTVPIDVQTREDNWGLRIWNVIQALRTLRVTGMTREVEVWGVVEGEVVVGIVDELGYQCPDAELEARITGRDVEKKRKGRDIQIAPDQATISEFFKPSQSSVSSSADPAKDTTQRQQKHIYITDVKTRNSRYVPSASGMKPTHIQLMLYRRLLTSLASNTVPASLIFERYNLDPGVHFSDELIQQLAGLEDNFDPSASASPSENATAPMEPAIETAVELLTHNNLSKLWELMMQEFAVTMPDAQETVSKVLQVEFRHAGDGKVMGKRTFAYDEEVVSGFVREEMRWWKGEREARGVEVEEAWKCGGCEFNAGCEWRRAKVEESVGRYRRRRTEGPVGG